MKPQLLAAKFIIVFLYCYRLYSKHKKAYASVISRVYARGVARSYTGHKLFNLVLTIKVKWLKIFWHLWYLDVSPKGRRWLLHRWGGKHRFRLFITSFLIYCKMLSLHKDLKLFYMIYFAHVSLHLYYKKKRDWNIFKNNILIWFVFL